MIKMTESSETVFKSRYAIHENETWEDLAIRVGAGAASVESNKREWAMSFGEMISEMLFIPGGRILRNIGRSRGTLFNCYCLRPNDSIESIAYTAAKSLVLWSEGGGVGFNFSDLRPEDAPIIRKGGTSSGPLSFIDFYNAGAQTIKTGGARRAAALGLLLCSHPDIVRFIDSKKIDGKLNNFNISVGVVDKFLDAVDEGADWELTFNQRGYDMLPAKDLWNKIVHNMVKYAEPGLLNWDNVSTNNSYYFNPIAGTNPCGEAILGDMEVCCLGSLVLPNFILGTKSTNWKLLEKTVHQAVRFLDNIIHINNYVMDDIKEKAFDGRRIGLGVMGLAEYLFAKNLRYGSEEAVAETERIMKKIRDFAYEASIKLAVEKGPFPKFDSTYYGKAKFIRTLKAPIRRAIKAHGVRNVTLMAFAPTGTISLLPEVTSGIEPLTFKSYLRHDEIGDRVYVHKMYEQMLLNNTETPDWYVDTTDLNPQDHLEMQVACQKYIDGAVSKTINCPKDVDEYELGSLLREYIRDLKGVTVYVDGSKGEQILNNLSREETLKRISESTTAPEAQSCANGSCEV